MNLVNNNPEPEPQFGATNYEIIKINKLQDKVSIYFSIRKLVAQIKKYLIKDLYRRLTHRATGSKNPNPKLIDRRLYELDFEVELLVNKCKPIVVRNHDLSIYDSLYLVEDAFAEGVITAFRLNNCLTIVFAEGNLFHRSPDKAQPEQSYQSPKERNF